MLRPEIRMLESHIEKQLANSPDSEERAEILDAWETQLLLLVDRLSIWRDEIPDAEPAISTSDALGIGVEPVGVERPIFVLLRDIDQKEDVWTGIHMRFGISTPWEWKGIDRGWIPMSGMISPWWGESMEVTADEARTFIATQEGVAPHDVQLNLVSEGVSLDFETLGLTDEFLKMGGLSRARGRQ